jgi:hypothetical protein
VVHTCNSSYSGDKDQEGVVGGQPRANSFQDPISKTINTKRAGRVAQVVGIVPV